MSEKEKEIIKKVASALPNMTDMDKGYFLGFAEAMASQNKEVDANDDDLSERDRKTKK